MIGRVPTAIAPRLYAENNGRAIPAKQMSNMNSQPPYSRLQSFIDTKAPPATRMKRMARRTVRSIPEASTLSIVNIEKASNAAMKTNAIARSMITLRPACFTLISSRLPGGARAGILRLPISFSRSSMPISVTTDNVVKVKKFTIKLIQAKRDYFCCGY
nr:hypothetical protein orf25 [uncultured archaeon]